MKLVNESLHDFLNEDFLAEEYLNEKFDLNTIGNVAKKTAIISSIILTSLGMTGEKKEILKHKIANSPIVMQMAQNPNLTKEDIFLKLSSSNFFRKYLINQEKLKDPLTLIISQHGVNFIKRHEKLKLTAYKIGDGKITIGYGHAEPINVSQFKEGQEISKQFAEKLFANDLKKAEDGVRRLFIKWSNEGIGVKLTQSMWDSMVSMAFNMGVNGLRGSELVQALKYEDYFTAAELIPSTKVSDNFPGLQKRREKEKELFLADVN